MLKTLQRQDQKLEQRYLSIRMADLLEMAENDYRQWVRTLEQDPLYRRLNRPADGTARVIKRRPWAEARWHLVPVDSLERAAAPAEAPPGEDVPADLLEIIRGLGSQRFERWFLSDDGTSLEDCAAGCGLSVEQASRLRDFLDGYLVSSGGAPAPAAVLPYETLAAIEPLGARFVPAYLSRHYARGLYQIDYDRLRALRDSLAPGERRRLAALVRQMELANSKQTVLAGLLRLSLEQQKGYLKTADPAALRPLSQKDAAAHLKVSVSAVSRALKARSVRLPWGSETPLQRLFPSRKEVALNFLRDVLERRPELSDRELAGLLKDKRGIRVTQRNVNLYRHALAGRQPRRAGDDGGHGKDGLAGRQPRRAGDDGGHGKDGLAGRAS